MQSLGDGICRMAIGYHHRKNRRLKSVAPPSALSPIRWPDGGPPDRRHLRAAKRPTRLHNATKGPAMLAASLAPWLSRHGIHYGWLMVALTFLATVCTSAATTL